MSNYFLKLLSTSHKPQRGSQSGITMIEILVTLVIVSVGLLGAAAMAINGLQSNRSAYLRTQASILAYDMADRIRTNSESLGTYIGFSSENPPELPACFTDGSGCGSADIASADMAQWAEAIEGANGGVILLPDAQGTITGVVGGDITITVLWEDDIDEAPEDQSQSFALSFNL